MDSIYKKYIQHIDVSDSGLLIVCMIYLCYYCIIVKLHIVCACILSAGKVAGLCMICELRQHVKKCFENRQGIVKPISILQKLRCKSHQLTSSMELILYRYCKECV